MTATQRRRYSRGNLDGGYHRRTFSPVVCKNPYFDRTTTFRKRQDWIALLPRIIMVAVLASSAFISSTAAFTPSLQRRLFPTTTTLPRRMTRFQALNRQQRQRRRPRWSSSLCAERINGDDGFSNDRIDDDNEDNDNEGEDDWRAFRARLVQNGITTTLSSEPSPPTDSNTDRDDDTPSSTTTKTTRYAHESTPLVEVGTVLVSIPTTDLNRILTHPDHHRSVVLITSVVRHGEWMEQGEEEGEEEAGTTYHGILLNRPVLGLGLEGRTMYGGNDQSPIYHNHHTSGNDGDEMGADSGYHCLLHHPSPSSTSIKSSSKPKHKSSSWSNNVINHFSTRLVGSLSVTSMDGAQSICRLLHGNGRPSTPPPPFDGTDYDDGLVVRPRDFYTFAGHITWNPGELEHEIMEGGAAGGGWLALSVDEVSIVEELDRMWPDESGKEERIEDDEQKERRRGDGMWRRMLERIGKDVEEATGFVPAGQIGFYDHMLEIWTEENLGYRYDDVHTGDGIVSSLSHPGQRQILGRGGVEEKPNDSEIGPGTVVRATDGITSDFLLYDQEFVRSVVLVLEETDEATVGVLLDHASSVPIDYCDDVTSFSLPLRYGGPMDLSNVCDTSDCTVDDMEYGSDSSIDQEDESEEDNTSPTLLWLHSSSTLASLGSENGGGSPVGTSGIYILSEEEALAALRSGILRVEETKVFCGVCVWDKVPLAEGYGDNWYETGEGSRRYCGGLIEQVETFRSMEVVRSCNDNEGGRGMIKSVWDILSRKQGILTEETLDSNIGAAIDAWEACNSGGITVGRGDSHRDGLPEAILRAWVGVNLLGDRLGTFVEVNSEAARRRRN